MEATALEIVKDLNSHGHEAYFAGGTVRDLLLDKTPKDYDIVTSAKPEEIEDILEHTIPIGKKFGVILAVKNGHNFEVATFRSDAAYSDGRRPDAVYFTDPKEDALRRDFTINGMFYDPTSKAVLDFVGGQKDLKDKTLRFIGDPHERLLEDNLRLMRAIRFKNSLGFEYALGVPEAIKRNADLIKNVSAERIQDELSKILTGNNRGQAFRELSKTGILKIILPEVEALKGVKQPELYHHEGDVFEHTLMSLDALVDPSKELAWAVLLHDIGKPATYSVDGRIRFNSHAEVGADIAMKIGKRLKFSREMTANLHWLVAHHMMLGDLFKMKKTRQAHWIHQPLFNELLELLRADALGTKPKDLSMYNDLKKLSEEKEALLPKPEPLITGKDIMDKFGIKEGPKIGEIINQVHHAQMEEHIKTKEEAVKFVQSFLKK
ncbi:CCA tRNA nucleotidyltransferase [candidate division WS5 bacterium]|uniref:CCA tRNA nucleotidyltransferase n=1 Tax=candidate division WS5 bacterium TaxID=2093353 RepID=A0A419DFM5_9BACT|nr:MAG: CCA tRNA nucleotidyltransferase [candidate division WS5 bacterium]